MGNSFKATNPVRIYKLAGEFGDFHNMSRHNLIFDAGHSTNFWRTAEHAFQATRFPPDHKLILEMIKDERLRRDPFHFKNMSKRNSNDYIVRPHSDEDLENMRKVITAKFKYHGLIRRKLLNTGDRIIIEDESGRRRTRMYGLQPFWGAYLAKDDEWRGHNTFGFMLMQLRESLRHESAIDY